MRARLVRSFVRFDLIVATILLAALGACEHEAPTGLTLEGAPVGLNCVCIEVGPPPLPGAPVAISGVVGQPVTISLQAVDRNGRGVAGVPISWVVLHNGGSIDVASSTTDTSGTAKVTWTLDTIVKLDSLRASLASGAALLVTATAQHGNAFAATKISGDSQAVAPGEASEPFIVRLTDRYGNPISGVHVGWIVNGGGTLSALTTATDMSGTTQVTLSTDSSARGMRQIVATYGVLRASTFTLTATSASTSASQTKRIRIVTHPIP